MIAAANMTRSKAFWSASEAYTRARRANIKKKASGLGGADEIVRKEARWRANVGRYLSHRQDLLSAGFDGIRVDPQLYEDIAELMAAMAPALQAAFDKHLGKIAMDAFRLWPVASGLSKSLISLEYVTLDSGDGFRAILRSRAPYTVFIKEQPHRVLLQRPVEAALDEIVRDGMAELGR